MSDDGTLQIAHELDALVSRLTQENAQLKAENERLTAAIRARLTCRNGHPHYCPNCDHSIGPDLLLEDAP